MFHKWFKRCPYMHLLHNRNICLGYVRCQPRRLNNHLFFLARAIHIDRWIGPRINLSISVSIVTGCWLGLFFCSIEWSFFCRLSILSVSKWCDSHCKFHNGIFYHSFTRLSFNYACDNISASFSTLNLWVEHNLPVKCWQERWFSFRRTMMIFIQTPSELCVVVWTENEHGF